MSMIRIRRKKVPDPAGQISPDPPQYYYLVVEEEVLELDSGVRCIVVLLPVQNILDPDQHKRLNSSK